MERRVDLRAAAALLVLFAPACVTEPAATEGVSRRKQVRSYTLGEQVPEREERRDAGAQADPFPPGLLPPTAASYAAQDPVHSLSPYHRFSHQTLRAPDGRLTRLYWVRANSAAHIVDLLKVHTRAGQNGAEISVKPNAAIDPRPAAPPPGILSTMYPGVNAISDLILVTAEDDVLLEVDQFLAALLTETPQIEIEAQVVEIRFEDGLETGSNLVISERQSKFQENADGTETFLGKGNDKQSLFSKFTSPLDPNAFLSGGQVGTLALAFFEDDMNFRAFLRAIQTSSQADVLSAPKMAVINGSRAVIDTGSRIPVQTPVLGASGQLTQVQVKFEDVGVKLIVTPYLLMDDMIQVDVMAEVSSVSAFVASGATGILNPIISSRTASTVVNVRNGQTFAIGGLISTDEIELVTKIPILGDIPLLGHLFKTRSVTEQQSQVIFFIKPKLVPRAAPLFDPEA